MRSRAERLAAGYRGLAILVLNTLLLLVLLEVVAGIAIGWSDQSVPRKSLLPYYQAQEWNVDFWADYRAEREKPLRQYAPYVGWRRVPFRGKLVNIEPDGRRRTPGAECVPGALRVWAFGGSTMEGEGAPDWGTIPAHLQERLDERHERPVCVVNLGQGGWVSTQEVIELALRLRDGERPDVAVFYDGINDVFAAYQSRRAGVHQNLEGVRRRFDGDSFLVEAVLRSHTADLLGRIAHRLRGRRPRHAWDGQEVDVEALAAEVVDSYLGNVRTARALAARFGFRALFFWQPLLMVEQKPLSQIETLLLSRQDPKLVALYRAVYARMARVAERELDLHDISDVFSQVEEGVYSDPYHVTPEANALLARRMLALAGPLGPPQD